MSETEFIPCVHCAKEFARLRMELEQASTLAYIDELTGLANIRHFNDAIVEAIYHAQRTSTPLSVAVIDLDHFKLVNDAHGHATGDHVLQRFAEILKKERRTDDCTARVGGEEFAVILRECDTDGARAYLARLYQNVHEQMIVELPSGSFRVTASFGHAAYEKGDTAKDLREKADDAMYAAKRAGRNCIKSFPS